MGSLLIAADKYSVEGLRHLCEECYLDRLTSTTAAELLVLADCRNCPRLKQKALDLIKDNTADAMRSPGWLEHLAKNAELLNQVLGHIAGVQDAGTPGSATRGTKRALEA